MQFCLVDLYKFSFQIMIGSTQVVSGFYIEIGLEKIQIQFYQENKTFELLYFFCNIV